MSYQHPRTAFIPPKTILKFTPLSTTSFSLFAITPPNYLFNQRLITNLTTAEYNFCRKFNFDDFIRDIDRVTSRADEVLGVTFVFLLSGAGIGDVLTLLRLQFATVTTVTNLRRHLAFSQKQRNFVTFCRSPRCSFLDASQSRSKVMSHRTY